MRKLTQITAAALVIAGLIPTLALAKNNQKQDHMFSAFAAIDNDPLPMPPIPPMPPMPVFKIDRHNDQDQGDNQNRQTVNGTVSATSTTGFSLTDKNSTIWTVNATGATIIEAFGQTMTLADVTAGSHANVQGTASGTTISATKIVVSPANTHPASGRGKVTAISGNSFTLQLNNHGIVSSATVNTSASTTVVTQNGATTTTASIVIGSKVAVKGLWDEILNVLNAIKVKIF